MNDSNRRENAAREASLGDDALRAAEALLALALYNDSVSRSYYAAFHYARALLLVEGLEPKTHHEYFPPCRTSFPVVTKITSSAILVAWSPKRSKFLAIKITSNADSAS